jgi:hypothetical protein
LAAVKNFGISIATIHNDSTAVSLFGSYSDQEKSCVQLRLGVLERRLRKEMDAQGIKSIKSLPESRPSETPAWEQIVRLFEDFSRYDLMENRKLVRSFNDKPSEI